MLNARSVETAILGGYVEHVTQQHPTAPLPGVYLTDEIFENDRFEHVLALLR